MLKQVEYQKDPTLLLALRIMSQCGGERRLEDVASAVKVCSRIYQGKNLGGDAKKLLASIQASAGSEEALEAAGQALQPSAIAANGSSIYCCNWKGRKHCTGKSRFVSDAAKASWWFPRLCCALL